MIELVFPFQRQNNWLSKLINYNAVPASNLATVFSDLMSLKRLPL